MREWMRLSWLVALAAVAPRASAIPSEAASDVASNLRRVSIASSYGHRCATT